MTIDIKAEWARRPWWLNLVLLFSIYMAFIYSPFDVLFKSLAHDEDVWLGYMFYGCQAKIGGVVHWIVYGALAWGLWTMRPWAWLLGSVYSTQVALAMLLWPLLQSGTANWPGSLIAGALFAVPAVAFWRSRKLFQNTTATTR